MPTKEQVEAQVKSLKIATEVPMRAFLKASGGQKYDDLEELCGPRAAMGVAASPKLTALLEAANKIPKNEQMGKLTDKFGDLLFNEPQKAKEIDNQLAANPALHGKFLVLYQNNPAALAEALPKIFENPTNMEGVISQIPATPKPVVTAPAPQLETIVKEADRKPNRDSEIAANTPQLGGPTIAMVLDRASKESSSPASRKAIGAINSAIAKDPDFAMKVNTLMGANPGLDSKMANLIKSRPQLVADAMPSIAKDPYKLKILTENPDKVQKQIEESRRPKATDSPIAPVAPAASRPEEAAPSAAGEIPKERKTAMPEQEQKPLETFLAAQMKEKLGLNGNPPPYGKDTAAIAKDIDDIANTVANNPEMMGVVAKLAPQDSGASKGPAVDSGMLGVIKENLKNDPHMIGRLNEQLRSNPEGVKRSIEMVNADPEGAKAMASMAWEVGMKNGQLRPGFASFMTRVQSDPELKDMLQKAGKNGKDSDLMKTLKAKLEEDPSLFEKLDEYTGRHPRGAKKAFGMIAGGDMKGGMSMMQNTMAIDMVVDMIASLLDHFSPGAGASLRNWIDAKRDTDLGMKLEGFAHKVMGATGLTGNDPKIPENAPAAPAATAGAANTPAPGGTANAPAPTPGTQQVGASASQAQDPDLRDAQKKFDISQLQLKTEQTNLQVDELKKKRQDMDAKNGSSPSTSGQTDQGPANPTSGTDRLDDTARARTALYSPGIAEGQGAWRISSSAQNGGHDVGKYGPLGNNVKLGERGDLSGEWKAVGLSDTNVIVSPVPPTTDNRPQQQQATYKPVQQVSVPT